MDTKSIVPQIKELPKFSEVSDDFRLKTRHRESKWKPVIDLLDAGKTVKIEEKTDNFLNSLRVMMRNSHPKFRIRSVRQPDYFVIWLEAK